MTCGVFFLTERWRWKNIGPQRARELFRENPVGTLEAGPHLGELEGKLSQHIHVLRPLAGEEEGHLPVRAERLLGEVDSPGVGEVGLSRGAQTLPDREELLLQIFM